MTRLPLILALLAGCASTATIAPPAAAPKSAVARTVAVDKNGWPDRRPISGLTLSMPSYRNARNPNGFNEWWYGDLDHADPDFARKFRERFDNFFDDALKRAKKQDAQGILIKDVEGSFREHANTYGGDPVHGLTDVTREQIKGWADKAQKEGLWLGFLIRDSINVNGMQAVAWDAAATFADKINETKSVYGLKKTAIDYDSNAEPGVAIRSAAYMARVRQMVGPDVLIIGEFYAAGYENVPAVCAVAHDPKHPGMFDPPQDAGFVFLVPVNNSEFPRGYPDALYLAWFTQQLRRGAVPLMASTWDSPENEWVARCVAKAAAGK